MVDNNKNDIDEPVVVGRAGEGGGGQGRGGGGGGEEESNGESEAPSSASSDLVHVSPPSSSSSSPERVPRHYPLRGSVVAGGGIYRIDTHCAEDMTPELMKQIRVVHEECFPEEKEEDEDDEGWLQHATFCHEPGDCVWILLWELNDNYENDGGGGENGRASKATTTTSTLTSSSSSAAAALSFTDALVSWLPPFFKKSKASPPTSLPSSPPPPVPPAPSTLVGIVTGVPYSSSLFGFNLGVAPRLRGSGLGARLMHALQAAARARGLGAISATVDASKRGLVAYYCGHGGVVESAGVTSPDSAPPTVVRIVKRFDDDELRRVTREADDKIAALAARRRARERARRRLLSAAAAVSVSVLAAAAAAAVSLLALALLRGRQRRRLK